MENSKLVLLKDTHALIYWPKHYVVKIAVPRDAKNIIYPLAEYFDKITRKETEVWPVARTKTNETLMKTFISQG